MRAFPIAGTRHGGELQGVLNIKTNMDKPHQAKTFNEVCVGPEGSTQRWLVKHKEQDLEGEARTVRRQTGTEIQTGCGDHKSLKSSCVGRCDSLRGAFRVQRQLH